MHLARFERPKVRKEIMLDVPVSEKVVMDSFHPTPHPYS